MSVKLPKNKTTVYSVVRQTMDVTGGWVNPTTLAIFELYDVATDYAGACYQEWADKGADPQYVDFSVQAAPFYG